MRRGFSPEVMAKLKGTFRYLLQSKLNTTSALQQIQRDRSLACAEVQYLLDFIRSSQRGGHPAASHPAGGGSACRKSSHDVIHREDATIAKMRPVRDELFVSFAVVVVQQYASRSDCRQRRGFRSWCSTPRAAPATRSPSSPSRKKRSPIWRRGRAAAAGRRCTGSRSGQLGTLHQPPEGSRRHRGRHGGAGQAHQALRRHRARHDA